jgi:hypothetical protein
VLCAIMWHALSYKSLVGHDAPVLARVSLARHGRCWAARNRTSCTSLIQHAHGQMLLIDQVMSVRVVLVVVVMYESHTCTQTGGCISSFSQLWECSKMVDRSSNAGPVQWQGRLQCDINIEVLLCITGAYAWSTGVRLCSPCAFRYHRWT